MAKFHGKVGFIKTEETSPGVWSPTSIERDYKGDIIREVQRFEKTEFLNDNITINNRFSIVADPYLFDNMEYAKYILWNETAWTISSMEIKRPRLIISVRGVYSNV